MEEKNHSAQFLRKRKFLMVLPILALPFISIFFIALGGGKENHAAGQTATMEGINTTLPDAHFKKGKEKDKLGLYEEAGKDSVKLHAQMQNDPYFKKGRSQLENILQQNTAKFDQPNYSKLQTTTGKTKADENEEKIMQKLAQLKTVISKKTIQGENDPGNKSFRFDQSQATPEITRLESMMQMVNAKSNAHDQDLDQLSGMLDKIILVQHPEKLQDSMLNLSEKNKAKTFLVTNAQENNNVTIMGNRKNEIDNPFYGLDDEVPERTNRNAIEAVIPETQTLVSGATVKMRLLNDISIGSLKIPKDENVFGTASLNNERLKISITSINYKDNILPVSLDVFDLDGMQGLYVPGSIYRDVSKQSADDALGSIGFPTIDPSLGSQAASAGIQAAKTLMSKKIKLLRITVKEGYHVLLRDNNQN